MNTKALRQKILDLAIHGKLVPQNPKDESATVLLERIRAEKDEKIKRGELKADKKDSFIFVGSDKRHYEQFADGTVKDIEDEIPFDVPEGWAWCRLGNTVKDIADIDHKMPEIKEEGIPFISPIDFTKDGKIDFQNAKKISKSDFERLSQKIKPSVNDIIFPRYGTIGVLRLVNSDLDFLVSYSCATIVTDKVYSNPKYIYYALQTSLAQSEINKYKVTTTQSNIGIKSLKQFFIPLAPLAEQQCIVSSIESIFAQIDMLEQNKSNLETAIKQAKSKILDLAIHCKLVPQDPSDEPASVLIEKLANADKSCEFANGKLGKCSEGTRHNRPYEKVGEEPFEIPHSWKWVRLGSVCDYGKCINVSTSDLRANDWILDLEDIEKDSGKILAFHTLKERKSESTKHKFTKGQVLYSKLRPYLNKVVIAPKDGFCTSEILPLDFNEILLNRFAQIVLMSSYFLTLVNMVTYGVKMPRLGTGDAKNMLIPIPPLNEQKRIVSKIDELFSNLDQIQNNRI